MVIACVVVNCLRLLLADELTSVLDDASAAAAIDLLLHAADSCGALLVVATHDARVRARFARTLQLPPPR